MISRDSTSNTMYSGEDQEVYVELGCLGKGISAAKAAQPEKSKAGGKPVGSRCACWQPIIFHGTVQRRVGD